eukprot:3737635-Alexandrium_andersonii.AAC.1
MALCTSLDLYTTCPWEHGACNRGLDEDVRGHRPIQADVSAVSNTASEQHCTVSCTLPQRGQHRAPSQVCSRAASTLRCTAARPIARGAPRGAPSGGPARCAATRRLPQLLRGFSGM